MQGKTSTHSGASDYLEHWMSLSFVYHVGDNAFHPLLFSGEMVRFCLRSGNGQEVVGCQSVARELKQETEVELRWETEEP